jgi:hypothetical protein
MLSNTTQLVRPSAPLLAFFLTEIHGDLSRGAVPPTLASARMNAGCLDDGDVEDLCDQPSSAAALLEEVDRLTALYGEDCRLIDLVGEQLPYSLASRVLPSSYRRVALDVALQDVVELDACSLPAWLESRSPAAGELADFRLRVLGHVGNRLRIELTGEVPGAPVSPWVENPMVPAEEVPLGAGCDAPGPERYCGYSAGGFVRLCPRCLAIHEAQQALLATF